MKWNKALLLFGSCCLLAAVCGKSAGSSSNSGAPAGGSTHAADDAKDKSPAPAEPELPSTLTDVNLAGADVGGAVKQLSASNDVEHPDYGPGLLGRRLIDGVLGPTWFTPKDWNQNQVYNKDGGTWAKFPVDIVVSFFERQPALVGGVTIVVPQTPVFPLNNEPTAAPKDVEIWTSMDLAPEKFVKATAATVETGPGEHTVQFPARQARFVRLRVLSGESPRMVEMAELRVLEAARDGYVPLFKRAPDVQHWKGSPREAAQRGLDWLQQSAADWSVGPQACFGCHVQAQAIMGQEVALAKNYRVSMPALDAFAGLIRARQDADGSIRGGSIVVTETVFGVMGLARANLATAKTNDPVLLKALDYVMAAQRSDGSVPEEGVEAPIMQGEFMLTANTLVGLKWAATHSNNQKYGPAADRALAWIAANEPVTTQDEVFKIVALMRDGTPDHKRLAWPVVERLGAEQQPDGGWKEAAKTDGSNAFATGQVLYALKQAGGSVSAPTFKRAVDYLLRTQVTDTTTANGSWKAVHTQSDRKSDFAPTMWAVIGLAASYGTEPVGALRVMQEHADKPAPPNLEIVLDVSGSMKTALGDSTRWQTALKVLDEVTGTLPPELKVGLRVYGHRYPSKDAQTCQDTELVLPIGPLDRTKLLQRASQLSPKGETPLILSVLKAAGDLKGAGGGSVILITDGEESCHGNARSAAAEIKKTGVNIKLNIVGFTLTGKAVENDLNGLAGSTGGRYYGAQDGAQLSRALKIAAIQSLPYDVLDASGKVVASGQSSQLDRELAAGPYTVRIRALDQVLEAPVTIVPNQTVSIAIGVDNGRFVIRK